MGDVSMFQEVIYITNLEMYEKIKKKYGERMKDLLMLEEGWDDRDAKAIKKETIEDAYMVLCVFEELFINIIPENKKLIVAPGYDGSIDIEFKNNDLDLFVKIPEEDDEIKELSGYEFQNAVIRALDPSLSVIKIGGKGADGGIDGSYYNILISVKKYKAGRKDLDEFIATLYRHKKKAGIFIALEFTGNFVKEIARLKREQGIEIHTLTLKEIIEDKKHEEILSKENQKHGKLM